MQNEDLIPAHEFCSLYNIEYSFISSLHQCGLIQVTTVHENGFIPVSELPMLEKLVRLHYDLEINLEGIETVTYLLQKVETMQQEICQLRNRLKFHESITSISE